MINLHSPSTDPNVRKFENIVYGNCFAPLISLATHHKPNSTPSCIDNILVNSFKNVLMSGIVESCVSHHSPIFCIFDDYIDLTPSYNSINLPKYDYCESIMTQFNEKLAYKLQ